MSSKKDERRQKVRWTPEEMRTLTMAIGAFGIDYIARKVHRSPMAVYQRIRQQIGSGGVGRGTQSLRAVSEATGYMREQLQRAGRALGQRWQKTSTYGRVMLSEDQVEALVRWLAHDYWDSAARVYACVYCGRTDIPPKGLGLCYHCYLLARGRFRAAGRRFNDAALLSIAKGVSAALPEVERDWADAFVASLGERCVLSRGTLDRLLLEAIRLGIDAPGKGDSPSGEVQRPEEGRSREALAGR